MVAFHKFEQGVGVYPPQVAGVEWNDPNADCVHVLLALYNGSKHLHDQLDSYVIQDHPNWRLIASDDGSRDDSRDIIGSLSRALDPGQVHLIDGPRRGFAANFLHLLRALPSDARFAALSDQDDVWFNDKLTRALDVIREAAAEDIDRPILYSSRSFVTDEDLSTGRLSPNFKRGFSFRNALVQNIAAGNTIVLNRPAIELLRAAALEAGEVVAHDWWIYQMITGAGGLVLRDLQPTLFYRQHGQNVIGANANWKSRIKRLRMVMDGRFAQWGRINRAALMRSRHRFTPENRDLLERFVAFADAPLIKRPKLMMRLGLYRQGLASSLILWAAMLFGRV